VVFSHVASGTSAASPVCFLGGEFLDSGFSNFKSYVSERVRMMAPERGPNRLNMKFTEGGRKVVIHLVRGLPPRISLDKKTITIIFPEQRTPRGKYRKPEAP
jgi:hypothetical protein